VEQTYYRWRKQYGGMGTDQLKELKRLQKENDRLRRAVRPEHRGGRRADGPKTGHALTFILDHLNRADHMD